MSDVHVHAMYSSSINVDVCHASSRHIMPHRQPHPHLHLPHHDPHPRRQHVRTLPCILSHVTVACAHALCYVLTCCVVSWLMRVVVASIITPTSTSTSIPIPTLYDASGAPILTPTQRAAAAEEAKLAAFEARMEAQAQTITVSRKGLWKHNSKGRRHALHVCIHCVLEERCDATGFIRVISRMLHMPVTDAIYARHMLGVCIYVRC